MLWVTPVWGKVTAPRGRHVVGRAAGCGTVLAGAKVSREHVEITPVGTVCSLRDLQSRNGVFLNGQRLIEQGACKVGDVVRVGEWVGCVLSGQLRDDGTAPAFGELAPGLLGGPSLVHALTGARQVAATDMPIVLEGATGTGKERLARAIHHWSGRSGPYVGVNCAAIPADLAEAELFGHRRGAFTGADKPRLGHFREADGGTLLLDEFLELPEAVQAKLLRVLEEREVQPVGESRPQPIDVRVLAATQEPLSVMVASGRVRSDLAARLGVVSIRLPELRARKEDIPPLFRCFFEAQTGAVCPPLTETLAEALCVHPFPQNVRELAWLARAVATLHPDEPQLDIIHLPEAYRAFPSAPASQAAVVDPLAARLLHALEEHGGVVQRAASAIGISRQKAYRILARQPSVLQSLRKRK